MIGTFRRGRAAAPSVLDPLHVGEAELVVIVEGDEPVGVLAQRDRVCVLGDDVAAGELDGPVWAERAGRSAGPAQLYRVYPAAPMPP